MSIYSYPESKVIDRITFRKTEQGGLRAYLHARPKADSSDLKAVLAELDAANMQTIPCSLDGQPALEVRGISKEAKLTKELSRWLPGNPHVVQEASDAITLKDKLKKRTLQASGVTYLIGDYGFWTYNRREADALGMAGAVSYFLGTLALIFYGRNDQSDLQVTDMADQLKHFVENEKIKLSEGSALHTITKERPKDIFQSMHEFGKRYPSELFNSVTALAGAFVAASAYKGKIKGPTLGKDAKAIKEMIHEGWMDFGLGTTTTASGVFATIVKEKKPDPDEPPPRNIFKRIWERGIQAHPLAIAGGGYTISTLFHAASTYKAYKEAKRVNDQLRLSSVPRRALFVSMALVSEFLLAISSKGHGQGVTSDDSVSNSVIALAADLIAMQPESQREPLMKGIAKFLSQPEILAMKDDAVLASLESHVEMLIRNPWTNVHLQDKPAAEGLVDTVKNVTPTWQTKISAQPAAGSQPQLSS